MKKSPRKGKKRRLAKAAGRNQTKAGRLDPNLKHRRMRKSSAAELHIDQEFERAVHNAIKVDRYKATPLDIHEAINTVSIDKPARFRKVDLGMIIAAVLVFAWFAIIAAMLIFS